MTERADMEAVFEAILFVANDPLPRERLLDIFADELDEATAALDDVIERYLTGNGRGFVIDRVGDQLRLVTRPDLHPYVRRFFDVSSANKLSMAALETLAIVAYRQPVTAPEIQELRSVNSSGVLKKLLERRLVRIAGRKEVVGKPFIYATTREFLLHFGLQSLKDLPPLEQFEELFGGDTEASDEQQIDIEEAVSREAAMLADEDSEAVEAEEQREIEEERRQAEADQEMLEVAQQLDSGLPNNEQAEAIAEAAEVTEQDKLESDEPAAADAVDREDEPGDQRRGD